ncbi:hypothetical protein GSH04_07245 [Burkholderia pseudomallei]|nr:hypothetical protein [Burkholderia pseudomallei]MBM5629730.1 hypothetical protein [Burkholderia pseudomallei]MBM5658029.1 hypothetical protein [Burkholderia pseudomallei]
MAGPTGVGFPAGFDGRSRGMPVRFSSARRRSGSRASVGRKAQGEKRNACGQAARMPNRPNAAQTCASRPRRLRGSRLA